MALVAWRPAPPAALEESSANRRLGVSKELDNRLRRRALALMLEAQQMLNMCGRRIVHWGAKRERQSSKRREIAGRFRRGRGHGGGASQRGGPGAAAATALGRLLRERGTRPRPSQRRRLAPIARRFFLRTMPQKRSGMRQLRRCPVPPFSSSISPLPLAGLRPASACPPPSPSPSTGTCLRL